MNMIRSTGLIGILGALMACTPQTGTHSVASAGAGNDCFWLSQVSGFTDAGDDRIYVHTGPSEVYLFETFGTCPDLDFTEKLALKQRSPGMICRGFDVDLIVPSAIGTQRCPVRMIQKVAEPSKPAP